MQKSTQILCVCFSIQHNIKHLNHNQTSTWSPEGGYPDSDMIDTFPRRALTSGSYGGLTLYVGMDDEDIEPSCNYVIHGFQVSTSILSKGLGSWVGYWFIVVTPDGIAVTKQSSGRKYLCFGRHCSYVFCRWNLWSPNFKMFCNCIVNI
jgi:hypothetical protein